MFATIRQYELGAGSKDDFMRVVSHGLAERLRQEPGVLAYHVVGSRDDTIVSVTVFGDEEGSLQSHEIAADFLRDRLQQFQPNLVSAVAGEVGAARFASAVANV